MRFSVSDHALVRYIERIYGIDMDTVRREVITDEECSKYAGFKDFKIKRDNCIVVVQDSTVVTVLSKEMENKHFVNKRDYEKVVHKRKNKK